MASILVELVSRWDVDGIELDYMRHPAFFRIEEGYPNRYLMTDFISYIRQQMDEIGGGKGQGPRPDRARSAYPAGQRPCRLGRGDVDQRRVGGYRDRGRRVHSLRDTSRRVRRGRGGYERRDLRMPRSAATKPQRVVDEGGCRAVPQAGESPACTCSTTSRCHRSGSVRRWAG